MQKEPVLHARAGSFKWNLHLPVNLLQPKIEYLPILSPVLVRVFQGMGEMGTYAIDLRSMTQSRARYTFDFTRYEDCPPGAQEKAIAEAKALAAEE